MNSVKYIDPLKDNFSTQAHLYSKFRPTYPKELYTFILKQVPGTQLAWDCATGNGQAAIALANHFDRVEATDLSQKQIDNATPHPKVHYSLALAHDSPFPNQQFDLITVAQAVHWFDLDAFYQEVRRVAKPGAILALWTYGLATINAEIDHLVLEYYSETLGSYWDFERTYVEDGYQSLPFPFEEIPNPGFASHFQWALEDLEGYLSTWSALQHYKKQNSDDPLKPLIQACTAHWPAGETLPISFPIAMRLGKVG